MGAGVQGRLGGERGGLSFRVTFRSEPELHDWVNEKDKDKKIRMQVTDEIKFAIDRYYFS
jgi:hypothetical protein